MSFTESIKSFFLNAFNFQDRAKRSEYWNVILLNTIIGVILGALTALLPLVKYVSALYGLIICIPLMALTSRRLHDIGKTGWLQVLPYIPISLMPSKYALFAAAMFVIASTGLSCLMALPSEPFTNEYGPGALDTEDAEVIRTANLKRFKDINLSQAIIYMVTSVIHCILMNLFYYIEVLSRYADFHDEPTHDLMIFVARSIIYIAFVMVVLLDRTKRGILSLIVSALIMTYSLASEIQYIYILATHDFTESMAHTITGVIAVIPKIITFILCLLFFLKKLKINKLTSLLCYSNIFYWVVYYLILSITYPMMDGIVPANETPYSISIVMNAGFTFFSGTALLYRFKHALYPEVPTCEMQE